MNSYDIADEVARLTFQRFGYRSFSCIGNNYDSGISELSRRSGVNRVSISNWFNHKRDIKVTTLFRLYNVLGVVTPGFTLPPVNVNLLIQILEMTDSGLDLNVIRPIQKRRSS